MSIPVTILGGFLGAGKTTALNHLLRHAECRMGVLVNDFGAVNIDKGLIEARDGDVVALTNGCVCCSIGPDLSESIARVARRDPAPERIVVEASGVSDPWRVAQLARLEPGVVLDAVLVLVDATGFTAHLADRWLTDTLERQLARADLIALSKCDLADAEARAATRAAVRRIRPDAPVLDIENGAVPGALLGAGAATGSRIVADTPGHGFRTWHWAGATPLDEGRLRNALDALPGSVLRAKGICRIGPDGVPHLLQLVGRRWTLRPWQGAAWEPGLVLIGTERLPPPDRLAALFSGTTLAAIPVSLED